MFCLAFFVHRTGHIAEKIHFLIKLLALLQERSRAKPRGPTSLVDQKFLETRIPSIDF